MTVAMAHRLRWILVWAGTLLWFVAQALNLGGNAIHVVLVLSAALLLYELLVEEAPSSSS